MTWRTLRRAVPTLALAFPAMLAAGCSDGTSAPVSSNTTVAPPNVLPASTTSPVSGADGPPTTLAGQTSVAATIAPEIDPAIEAAVKQAVQDFFAAYMACGQAPAQCHPADFHSSRGTAVGQGTVYFQGLAARGEYFGPDIRGSYIVTQSVALEDATSAMTFSCLYDATILLGPVDASGQPAVLDDKRISIRERQQLFFDGTWKVGEAATVQDLGDGNKCPPAGSTD